MPILFNPGTPKGGPGSTFHTGGAGVPMGRRRRRRLRLRQRRDNKDNNNNSNDIQTGSKVPSDNTKTKEDSMEWNEDETAAPASMKTKPIMEKKTVKKRRGKSPSTLLPKRRLNLSSKKSSVAVTPLNGTSPSLVLARSQSRSSFPNNRDGSNWTKPHCHFSIHRALLVDTRTLDTVQTNQISDALLSNVSTFLDKHCKLRGVLPSLIVASAVHDSSTSSMSHLPATKTTPSPRHYRRYHNRRSPPPPMVAMRVDDAGDNRSQNNSAPSNLPKLLIPPPINATNQRNKSVVKPPMRLLPHASWKLFGDLIKQAVDSSASPTTFTTAAAVARALSITLITTDIILLCDGTATAHQRGIEDLWQLVRPLFHDHKLHTIDLVIVETKAVLEFGHGNSDDDRDDVDNHDTSENDATDTTMTTPNDKGDADGDEKTMREVEDGSPPVATAAIITKNQKTIQLIKDHLAGLARQDYKTDRDRETAVTPVSISISIMENSALAFDALARRWTQEKIASNSNNKNEIKRPTLTFDLPESPDGTQCSVQFDIKYKILPFSADSPAVSGLLADLHLLSASHIQAVQLVPLSCLDASLLYLPMAVSAAFVPDPLQYNEMRALVHFLFQYLTQHQVALLLRSTPKPISTLSNEQPAPSSGEPQPLFHMDDQTFLLMAEEASCLQSDIAATPSTADDFSSLTVVPSEGMLVRCASAHQMVDVGSSELGQWNDKELSEFVVQAMDRLESNAVNPLLQQQGCWGNDEQQCNVEPTFTTTSPNNNDDDKVVEEDDKSIRDRPLLSPVQSQEKNDNDGWQWSDETGIGSLPSPRKKEETTHSTEDGGTNCNNKERDLKSDTNTEDIEESAMKMKKKNSVKSSTTPQSTAPISPSLETQELQKQTPSPESDTGSIFEAVAVSLKMAQLAVRTHEKAHRTSEERKEKARKSNDGTRTLVDDILVDTDDDDDGNNNNHHEVTSRFEN